MNAAKSIFVSAMVTVLSGCQAAHTPLATVERVDLHRFMGEWHVIANIPTFIERDAYNAVETYRLDEDGSIDTTFAFNKGGFDGPKRRYNPRGFILDKRSNSVWGMRFVWPIKADYRIAYINDAYTQTIVAREARDYVWIMARTPTISDVDYRQLLDLVQHAGYDVSLVKKVPQRSENNSEDHHASAR